MATATYVGTLGSNVDGSIDPAPDWYKLEGTDSVTLSHLIWYGHTPTFPAPTQNPVINVTCTRISGRLPLTNGT